MASGGGRKRAGRPKGTPNKSTERAKHAISLFVENNTERLQHLLDRIEKEDGALEAFKCIQSLIEYHVPKLSRAELNHEGEVGISSILAELDEPDERTEE